MQSSEAASITLAVAVLLALFVSGETTAPAHAGKPSQKQAMAACKAKYGNKVVKAIVNKNGTLTCQWRVVREMTRQEAYEACKKRFSATTAMVRKTKTGWVCRYYGRY